MDPFELNAIDPGSPSRESFATIDPKSEYHFYK